MDDFMLIPSNILDKQAVSAIIKCNEKTEAYGLSLTKTDAQELVNTRSQALESNGRIEFGGGIIDKIILAFCDSPFLTKYNYTEMLNELIETFYYFKNESMDCLGDDELMSLMKKYFDENCRGSIELLQNREMEKLAHNIRFDVSDYDDIPSQESFEKGDDYE